MARKFRAQRPSNADELSVSLTLFFGWGPREADQLTTRELLRWNEQAHRIAAARAKASQAAQRRR